MGIDRVGRALALDGHGRSTRDLHVRDVWLVAGIGLAARVLTAAGVWTYLALAHRPWLAPDEGTYLREADAVYRGSHAYAHAYGRVVGAVFKVTGPHAWVPRAANVIIGTAIAVALFELVRMAVDRSTAVVAGVITALWPSLVLWSVLALRDVAVVATVLCAFLGVLMALRGKWSGIVCVVLALIFVDELKPFAFVIASFAIGLGLVAHGLMRTVARWAVVVVLFVVVGVLGLARHHGLYGVGFALSQSASDTITATRSEGATGGDSGFGPARRTGTLRGLRAVLEGLPEGALYTLLGPFPWQTHSVLARLLLVIELPVWYAALALAVAGAISRRRDAMSLAVPILFAAGVAVVLSVYEGNAGTAFRERALVIPVVLGLAAFVASRSVRRGDQENVDRPRGTTPDSPATSRSCVEGPRPDRSLPSTQAVHWPG